MESKKDIGKVFRENLEQLDFSPSTAVWEKIESDLGKKKKKRRFLIWFFFIALIMIGGSTTVWVATSPGRDSSLPKSKTESAASTGNSTYGNGIVSGDEADKNSWEGENVKDHQNVIKKKQSGPESEKAGMVKNDVSTITKQNNNKSNPVRNSIKKLKKTKQTGKHKLWLAKHAFNRKGGKSGSSFSQKQNSKVQSEAEKTKGNSESTSATAIQDAIKNTVIDSLIAESTAKTKTPKKNKKEKDSLPKDSVPNIDKPKNYEIVIAPYYGMNYFGYFGESKAISNASNIGSEGKLQNIYGVMARWMFGGKFGIQTGIGKINNLHFNTIQKNTANFINSQNLDLDKPVDEINAIFATSSQVKFTYESSFMEIPIEAYYVLRDKKIGFATSFGVSVLFSGKNAVFAEADGIGKTSIGFLNTVSSSGITANGKLYVFYKITPSLHLDVYPSFQYQIMGTTDSSNYFFSVRTGLSYKF